MTDQSDRSMLFAMHLKTLQEVLARFVSMRVDSTEFACLKALVLFKSGKLI
ncbi:MAG: hypothetical protein ABW185_12775 [Sedimenticola sp.]